MSHLQVKIKLLNPLGRCPSYATEGSVAMDLYAAIESEVVIEPYQRAVIPCGFALEIPEGFEVQIRSRSGMAVNYGVSVLNSPGTIDPDYRGEIKVCLINLGQTRFVVGTHMRIAQMSFHAFARVALVNSDDLSDSIRAEGGFGSTGV